MTTGSKNYHGKCRRKKFEDPGFGNKFPLPRCMACAFKVQSSNIIIPASRVASDCARKHQLGLCLCTYVSGTLNLTPWLQGPSSGQSLNKELRESKKEKRQEKEKKDGPSHRKEKGRKKSNKLPASRTYSHQPDSNTYLLCTNAQTIPLRPWLRLRSTYECTEYGVHRYITYLHTHTYVPTYSFPQQ